MLMHLIRKDFLLAGKYVIVMIIFIVAAQALPMVFAAQTAVQSGSFLIGLVFGQLIFYSTLSQLDGRYPKATALLCSAPYIRDTFVKARYVLLMLLFVLSYIVNIIVTLIIGATPLLSPTAVLVALLVDVIIFGIYIPLDFKYGFTKVRFIYVGLILVIAFLPQLFVRLFSTIDSGSQSSNTNIIDSILSGVQSIPMPVLCLIMVLATIAVLYISIRKSIKIFNRKEL